MIERPIYLYGINRRNVEASIQTMELKFLNSLSILFFIINQEYLLAFINIATDSISFKELARKGTDRGEFLNTEI